MLVKHVSSYDKFYLFAFDRIYILLVILYIYHLACVLIPNL